MKRKILITKTNNKVLTTIIENSDIVEINCCKQADRSQYSLGNIYIGKVKKIISNINAAFIEVAKDVECYYKMQDEKLRIGDELVVQIAKEAMRGKAPSVTSKWTLPGQYVVLTVGESRIGISTKIAREKRADLRSLAKPCATAEYGFIIRTNAAEVKWGEVAVELKNLIAKYQQIEMIKDKRTCYSCLYQQPAAYLVNLRNVRRNSLEKILVEDDNLYKQISSYLQEHQPDLQSFLKKYEDTTFPLDKLYSIGHVIEESQKEKVWMKSGAYLMIQPTEACTVIDVNSGKAIRKKDVTLRINLEAAKEIAKQVRLRNLSGIILVDFINSENKEEIKTLLSEFAFLLKQDQVETVLVGMTKLQLVEITRKKIHKPLAESLKE